METAHKPYLRTGGRHRRQPQPRPAHQPLTPSPGILSDGETSAEEIHETVGRGGANTAAAAAVLGGRVHFYCAVGHDELGGRLVRFMEGMGVTMRAAVKPVTTGHSVALTWDTHQRHLVSSLPNTRLLEEADIDLKALRRGGCAAEAARRRPPQDGWKSRPSP